MEPNKLVQELHGQHEHTEQLNDCGKKCGSDEQPVEEIKGIIFLFKPFHGRRKYNLFSFFFFPIKIADKNADKPRKKTDDEENEENDSNATSSCEGNLVDSSLPPADKKQQRLSELQKLKANCKSEEFEKLKLKCEILVRDCIAGLLLQLSNDDFKAMEGKFSTTAYIFN